MTRLMQLSPDATEPRRHAVASPCVSVCRMSAATGYCEGCLRTLDEIAQWSQLDDDQRRAVLANIALRRAALDHMRG